MDGVQERRPLWKRYAGSILATLVVGLCMSAAVTLLLVRPQAVADFSADVAELRDDVERLAKRIERLRGGLA